MKHFLVLQVKIYFFACILQTSYWFQSDLKSQSISQTCIVVGEDLFLVLSLLYRFDCHLRLLSNSRISLRFVLTPNHILKFDNQ